MTNEVTLKDIADTLEIIKYNMHVTGAMVGAILGYAAGKIISGK